MEGNSTIQNFSFWRVRVFLSVSLLLVNIKLKEIEE